MCRSRKKSRLITFRKWKWLEKLSVSHFKYGQINQQNIEVLRLHHHQRIRGFTRRMRLFFVTRNKQIQTANWTWVFSHRMQISRCTRATLVVFNEKSVFPYFRNNASTNPNGSQWSAQPQQQCLTSSISVSLCTKRCLTTILKTKYRKVLQISWASWIVAALSSQMRRWHL